MLTFDRRFLFGSTTAAIPPALLLSALLCRPDLLTDAWQVSCFKSAMPEEKLREERLAYEHEMVRRREQAHDELAHDLAAGRLTLLEAAARLRDIDLHSPGFLVEYFRMGYPAGSDDERFCLAVIDLVRVQRPGGRERAEELVRRLEAELADLRARGPLRLPEPGDGPPLAP